MEEKSLEETIEKLKSEAAWRLGIVIDKPHNPNIARAVECIIDAALLEMTDAITKSM